MDSSNWLDFDGESKTMDYETERPKLEDNYENIAAISALFHTHKSYNDFYKKHGNCLGGFPGVWSFCVIAAAESTDRWDERLDEDWIEGMENYVDGIFDKYLSESMHVLDTAILKDVANKVISEFEKQFKEQTNDQQN